MPPEAHLWRFSKSRLLRYNLKSIYSKLQQTRTPLMTKARPRKKTTNTRRPEELAAHSLGAAHTEYKTTYSPEVLEWFNNKHPKTDAWTTFVCTEFTSLCPKTNQPDFARVFINYIADKKMVESKSLKLYLFSFRNHGDFHEDCIQKICDDLTSLLKPRYLEVIGEFTPRGGISIYPFASYASSSKKYQSLKETRFAHYAPGKYSMDLSRVY
jgi:7-cyano-7-deazaguanine reductase